MMAFSSVPNFGTRRTRKWYSNSHHVGITRSNGGRFLLFENKFDNKEADVVCKLVYTK
jgi:hypothetical protein